MSRSPRERILKLLSSRLSVGNRKWFRSRKQKTPKNLQRSLKDKGLGEIQVLHGPAGTVKVATHPEADFVVSAIVGVAGLEATYEAVKPASPSVSPTKSAWWRPEKSSPPKRASKTGRILPIDSEHNAVHQCLRGGRMEEVRRSLADRLGRAIPQHSQIQFSYHHGAAGAESSHVAMGRRITIDSATLMNKGFEVIEACRLFNLPPSQVKVIVHPQSTIHSMVEFVDGSILAQFSVTDMRLPILYALTYPDRIESDMRFPVMD